MCAVAMYLNTGPKPNQNQKRTKTSSKCKYCTGHSLIMNFHGDGVKTKKLIETEVTN